MWGTVVRKEGERERERPMPSLGRRVRCTKTEVITGVGRQRDRPRNSIPYSFTLLYPLNTTKANLFRNTLAREEIFNLFIIVLCHLYFFDPFAINCYQKTLHR